MKNKLIDLNNHLFAQLERMSEEDLKETELKSEILRSKAISELAGQVVANARLALDAEKLKVDYTRAALPAMIEGKSNV